MTPSQYIENCLRTENLDLPAPNINNLSPRMAHAILGVSSEGGELVDAMKKSYIYGKPFDVVNAFEELGDITWYISIALHEMGRTWEDLFEMNIAKLKARYPEKYTDDKALNRDLKTERTILESK